MVGLDGLEPSTSRLSGVRSNQNWAIGPFSSYTLKDQNIDLSKLNSKLTNGVDLGMS
jgi:hypothetical protein